jgi:NADH-quinone oxidoreductase subunit M
MNDAAFPVLTLSVLFPLAAALAVGSMRTAAAAKNLALAAAVVELCITLGALAMFDAADGGFQLQERRAWIAGLNIDYFLGIDGISVAFLPLTALLTLAALLASRNSAQHLPKLYPALLLGLESATVGVFCALDMALFFLFWELTLVPIFFLIALWGIGAHRRAAAMQYVLFMLAGGVPLLFGIVLLALNHAEMTQAAVPAGLSFSLPALLQTPAPTALQYGIFLLLLLGFAVKAPLIPLHTWLPAAAMEGPAALTALLVGLKLGVYGILRFAVPLAPEAARHYSWVLGVVGAITVVYGALIALRQSNLRRLLAYSSISHAGLTIVGIATLNLQGLQGAVLQLTNFTLIAASLMFIAGFIQRRLGSTEAVHLGGLAKPLPRLTALFFLFAFAGIGLPGLSSFPAELLLIIGALDAHPGLGISALAGAILGAAYMLGFIRRAFWGPAVHAPVRNAVDLLPRELAALAIPALLVVILGLYPDALLHLQRRAADAWLERIHTLPPDAIVLRQERPPAEPL